MPELPEVENTAKYLSSLIKGSFVRTVEVYWDKSIQNASTGAFKQKMTGLQINRIWRRGKYLIFDLEGVKLGSSLFMLAHLRMSGSFRVTGVGENQKKHDRVRVHLDGNRLLSFHDIRKFGRLYLVNDYKLITGKLGHEPLKDSLTPELVAECFNRKVPIKALLLRQDLLAGIGNIYADEALWQSGIHPQQPGCTIKKTEFVRLHEAIREVLAEAIANQGTNFGDNVLEYGVHQPSVYGRTGEECKRCRSVIERILITQRSSHFCPECQKLKKRKMRSGKA